MNEETEREQKHRRKKRHVFDQTYKESDDSDKNLSQVILQRLSQMNWL